jgi:hypothetical protein
MRALLKGEEPVLPVGFQSLMSGKNKDFNVFDSWGRERIANVSLIITPTGKYRLILSGGASPEGILFHDQTHQFISRYRLVREYTGTYPAMFNQILYDTGKRAIPAYVYK